MCQGLPYWASGGPALQSPCNNYEIRGTDFSDPPLFRDWVDYTDCYGVRRRQYVTGVGIPYDPSVVNICSHTTPTVGTDRPIGGARVTSTLISACDSDLPTIPCGGQASAEGQSGWPNMFIAELGTGTGNVSVTFTTGDYPDKCIIEKMDGTVVHDTGWYGSTAYQAQLNQGLADRGLPPEPIVAPSGTVSNFNKNFTDNRVRVKIYTSYWIVQGSSWWITLSCV